MVSPQTLIDGKNDTAISTVDVKTNKDTAKKSTLTKYQKL